MPYKKVGTNDYVSPSGKHINSAQLRLWHAQGEKWPGEKHSEKAMKNYAKGGDVRVASYAAGGPVLGRTREFLKEPDEFRDPDEHITTPDKDQLYGKSGEGKGTGMYGVPKTPKNKSLKTVKPKK